MCVLLCEWVTVRHLCVHVCVLTMLTTRVYALVAFDVLCRLAVCRFLPSPPTLLAQTIRCT